LRRGFFEDFGVLVLADGADEDSGVGRKDILLRVVSTSMNPMPNLPSMEKIIPVP
jgi:hypothetical protein